MNPSEITLEFNRVKEMLIDRAMSDAAKKKLLELQPILSERECHLPPCG